MKKKLLFLVAEDHYFCSHRLNLAQAAQKAGFAVAVATRVSTEAKRIQNAGIKLFPLRYFNRHSINPFRQLLALFELYKIYKRYHPLVVHQVAIKPVILGSLIAQWCRIPKVINALGGLGYLFTDKKVKTNLKKQLLHYTACRIFHFIFSRPNSTLILQNQDDLQTLIKANCVAPNQVAIIPGAGIDIQAFPVALLPPEPPVIITCISRMLWSKGIGELVMAAKILNTKISQAKVILYGMPDPENPTSISKKQLQKWHDAGIIIWKGQCQDVAKAYADCHIAVLPSYREGLPKTLLEAASSGRAIVTTDVPGCREVVKEQENGLLVPPRDSEALANALIFLIENRDLRINMGNHGRKRVEQYFADTLIHQQTIALYNNPRS